MKKLAVLLVAAVALVIGVPLIAKAVGAHNIATSIGDQPDLTPTMQILEPSNPVIKAGEPIPVVIGYSNFHADPTQRCAPAGTCVGSLPNTVTGAPAVDVGHIHVYFTPADGGATVQATSFCIPTEVNETNFAGTISGNCPALTEKGVYRMSAEFQSNSHVSSLKAYNSPQHIPVSDVLILRVS